MLYVMRDSSTTRRTATSAQKDSLLVGEEGEAITSHHFKAL